MFAVVFKKLLSKSLYFRMFYLISIRRTLKVLLSFLIFKLELSFKYSTYFYDTKKSGYRS